MPGQDFHLLEQRTLTAHLAYYRGREPDEDGKEIEGCSRAKCETLLTLP